METNIVILVNNLIESFNNESKIKELIFLKKME